MSREQRDLAAKTKMSTADRLKMVSEGAAGAEGTQTDEYKEPEATAAMRLEAISWPRIIYSPIKNAKHILIDSCTAPGLVQRYIITKGMGKQIYTDARKSKWGDAFPHRGAGKPVVRNRGIKKLIKAGACTSACRWS